MYTLSVIASVVNGELVSNCETDPEISDILIDSRKLISPSGTLFIALKTNKNDGHKYIPSLYQNGLRYFMVSSLPLGMEHFHDAHFLLVDDTLAALQHLVSDKRKNSIFRSLELREATEKPLLKSGCIKCFIPIRKLFVVQKVTIRRLAFL